MSLKDLQVNPEKELILLFGININPLTQICNPGENKSRNKKQLNNGMVKISTTEMISYKDV
jgi:hypothetical protein